MLARITHIARPSVLAPDDTEPAARPHYDNARHAWPGDPPPAGGLTAAEAARVPALLDRLPLRVARTAKGRTTYRSYPGVVRCPAWCRAACSSEQAALVLSRLLYWWRPKPLVDDVAYAIGRKHKPNLPPEQELRPRGSVLSLDNGCWAARAADRDLARQTGLWPSNVDVAIRWLDERGLVHLDKDKNGARVAAPNAAALAAAYFVFTDDPVAEAEYLQDDSPQPEWHLSETSRNAAHAASILHPRLLSLLPGRSRTRWLDARLLWQVIYLCSPKFRQPLVAGWRVTTLNKLGRMLGVCDDTVDAALDRLVALKLVRRDTWKMRAHAKSIRTTLCPDVGHLTRRLQETP